MPSWTYKIALTWVSYRSKMGQLAKRVGQLPKSGSVTEDR
jgi:hypothetical protein